LALVMFYPCVIQHLFDPSHCLFVQLSPAMKYSIFWISVGDA
jgi:hypothetical protein